MSGWLANGTGCSVRHRPRRCRETCTHVCDKHAQAVHSEQSRPSPGCGWARLISSRPEEQKRRFSREGILPRGHDRNSCLSFQPRGLPYRLGWAGPHNQCLRPLCAVGPPYPRLPHPLDQPQTKDTLCTTLPVAGVCRWQPPRAASVREACAFSVQHPLSKSVPHCPHSTCCQAAQGTQRGLQFRAGARGLPQIHHFLQGRACPWGPVSAGVVDPVPVVTEGQCA